MMMHISLRTISYVSVTRSCLLSGCGTIWASGRYVITFAVNMVNDLDGHTITPFCLMFILNRMRNQFVVLGLVLFVMRMVFWKYWILQNAKRSRLEMLLSGMIVLMMQFSMLRDM